MAKSPVPAPAPAAALRKIVLRSGYLIAVGPYRRDVEYEVDADQAAHLVAHRSFQYADQAPQAPETVATPIATEEPR
jgi:hypothetical protein